MRMTILSYYCPSLFNLINFSAEIYMRNSTSQPCSCRMVKQRFEITQYQILRLLLSSTLFLSTMLFIQCRQNPIPTKCVT